MASEVKLLNANGKTLTIRNSDSNDSDILLDPSDWQLQHGTNANGEYTKFPNGLLIQRMTKTITHDTADTNRYGSTSGTIYRPSSVVYITYPISFKFGTIPMVIGNSLHENIGAAVNASQVSDGSFIARTGMVTAGSMDVQYIAIGRWK